MQPNRPLVLAISYLRNAELLWNSDHLNRLLGGGLSREVRISTDDVAPKPSPGVMLVFEESGLKGGQADEPEKTRRSR